MQLIWVLFEVAYFFIYFFIIFRMAQVQNKVGRPAGQKPYGEQRGGQRKKTLREFQEFMKERAGNDMTLIFEYLQGKAKKMATREQANRLLELMNGFKMLKKLVGGLKTMCQRLPTWRQREVLSIMVDTGLTRQQVQSLGWHIGAKGV